MVKKFNGNKTEIQTSMKKLNNCDKKKVKASQGILKFTRQPGGQSELV